jgi:actin-like ATPase involved in cell morphogenesis
MHETGMSIVTADHPLQSVVLGSGAVLEEFDVLHAVLQSSGRL